MHHWLNESPALLANLRRCRQRAVRQLHAGLPIAAELALRRQRTLIVGPRIVSVIGSEETSTIAQPVAVTLRPPPGMAL